MLFDQDPKFRDLEARIRGDRVEHIVQGRRSYQFPLFSLPTCIGLYIRLIILLILLLSIVGIFYFIYLKLVYLFDLIGSAISISYELLKKFGHLFV